MLKLQTEDDELEVALALSLLEAKDCPPSSSSGSESSPDFKEKTNPQQVRPEVCSPRPTLRPQFHATDQTVSRSEGLRQSAAGEIHPKMGSVDLNPAEEHKEPRKRRRQRRRGAQQQIVGLPPSPSAAPPVLLWFRRDLRLCDNPALIASLEVGAPVIPIFIWSPEEEEGPGTTVAMGGACKLSYAAIF